MYGLKHKHIRIEDQQFNFKMNILPGNFGTVKYYFNNSKNFLGCDPIVSNNFQINAVALKTSIISLS